MAVLPLVVVVVLAKWFQLIHHSLYNKESLYNKSPYYYLLPHTKGDLFFMAAADDDLAEAAASARS